MSQPQLSIQLGDNLRDRATPILEGYGLSISQAIELFLNQIAAPVKFR